MSELLIAYKPVITVLHVLSMAIGVGGATLTDVFFFRFLKNFRISHEETKMMRVLSVVIWLALIGAIVTGFALYFTDPLRYNATPKFLVKALVVAVIVLNGLLLNFYISPRLTQIVFVHQPQKQLDIFRHFRRLSFASGAISLTSWYVALALGATRAVPFSFGQILGTYAVLLFVAVVSSQVMEKRYARLARNRS